MSRAFALITVFLASLFRICGTAPAHINQPYFPQTFSTFGLKRSISQDPSCPSGYLCDQEACPVNLICADGESCVNFEGTFACIPDGALFCALNPSTFEAVGCIGNQGVCCHGNCYVEGTVCCDNSGVQCSVGQLCNACPSGQTCGSNGCNGGAISTSTPPSSTSPTISVSPPPTTSTQPTSVSVTTTSTQPTSVSATTTTSSSTQMPNPTIVPSAGTFQVLGCYADAPSDRVLTNGSSNDYSSTGMTVEKCTTLAKGYQFAGVEYYGECYWGNFATYNTSENLGDCNAFCDGNAAEVCGGGNRILIYQDAEWVLLTDAEFVQQLQQLEKLLEQLEAAIQTWNQDLQTYNNAIQAATQGQKRRVTVSLFQLGTTVNLDQQAIRALLKPQNIEQLVLEIKFYLEIKVNQAQKEAEAAAEAYSNLAETIETTAEVITGSDLTVPVIADGVTPATAEVAEVAQILSSGTEIAAVVGAPEVIVGGAITVVATGIFASLEGVLSYFLPPGGGGGGGEQNPTGTTTSSSPTSTSSVCNICTAVNSGASLPTPIVAQTQKREVDAHMGFIEMDFVNLTSRHLEKRAGRIYNPGSVGSYGISFSNFQTQEPFCPDNLFTWHALKYPSTSSAVNQLPLAPVGGEENTNDGADDTTAVIPQSAPDFTGIGQFGAGPFIDIQYQYSTNSPNDNNGLQAWICGANIAGFADRFAGSQDLFYRIATNRPTEQNYYDTEHIFELHMIKDFFFWLVNGANVGFTCDALQAVFGGDDNAANQIMAQLAWYDPDLNQGTLSELYVLNRGLNHLKGAFMNGRPLNEIETTNQVFPRPTSWAACNDLLISSVAVFQFLNTEGPMTAFTNAATRVYNFLNNPAQFLEIGEAPQGTTFAGLWATWLEAWMVKRQSDVTLWRLEVMNTCRPLAAGDPCWSQNYNNLFNQFYPAESFTFPATWYPN